MSAPPLNSDTTQPSTESTQTVGPSRRTYFAVITLVALAMNALPAIFVMQFYVHVLPYLIQNPSSQDFSFWSQIVSYFAFLISPCLFFVILYLYGKRTALHFGGNYLRVIPLLFLGSALGLLVYYGVSVASFGSATLNGMFWLAFSYSIVSESVRSVFVGFTALGLSYLRAGKPLTALGQSPSA